MCFSVTPTECEKLKKESFYTGCPRAAKKLHNLFVIKDINFFFFLDDNIAVYTGCLKIASTKKYW
jgi:hypothetical protein